MTTTLDQAPPALPPLSVYEPPARIPRAVRVFGALLGRDIFVTGREIVSFVVQVVLQPLFLLLVLGKILPLTGYAASSYAQVLLPGIVAFSAFLTALQSTALPLVIDFSYTKEIEDRLLAPVPVGLVAIEQVVFATLRALVGGVLIFPLGLAVLGSVSITWRAVPMVALFLVLGSLVGSAVGLTLGTLTSPAKINVAFAVILTPLLFTGSTQFPWRALHSLRWFQVVCACNPLTYFCEGVRGEMQPGIAHLPGWLCALALAGFLVLFGAIGTVGFVRRAIG